MRYAETGFDLEVDLSRGNIERVETDPHLTELHLGGLGTNARLMWERVPPEVEPFSPENLLIFSAGLLCGTQAIGANRTIVTSLSPQTKLMHYSMMGGFWASELKYAGYDKVVIRGRSPDLVYLWIQNDKVEIRDATHLRGKGSNETIAIIRQELNEPKAQVAAIGLAGEKRVYFASIENGRSSAARGGLGAVMGDKNLKAVVVRGTKDVYVARPAEFMKLCNDMLKHIEWRRANLVKGIPPIIAGLGSPQEMVNDDEEWHTTGFSWGNARVRRKDFWTEEVAREWAAQAAAVRERLVSCFNCPMSCAASINVPGLSRYQMKCFSKLTYTMAAFSDLEFGYRICQRGVEYGLDAYATPQVIAFALELLEAGILTDADFPGMPADTEGRFFYLQERIANREGIGDVLADGTYYAAEQIGNGADAYAHNTIKRHEQLNLKLGMLNPIYFLMFATNEKINITQIEGNFPQEPFPTREEREEFVKDWYHVPDERFKQWFVDWEPRTLPYYPTIEMTCAVVDWAERMHYIDDSLGLCAGLGSFPVKPAYHIHNLPDYVSAATGFDMDEAELWQAAKRNRTMVRAVQVRRGLRRKDERPPDDHWKHRFPELEQQLLDEYYKLKGWNLDGIPTRETLAELSLGFVGEELERRGILQDGQD